MSPIFSFLLRLTRPPRLIVIIILMMMLMMMIMMKIVIKSYLLRLTNIATQISGHHHFYDNGKDNDGDADASDDDDYHAQI